MFDISGLSRLVCLLFKMEICLCSNRGDEFILYVENPAQRPRKCEHSAKTEEEEGCFFFFCALLLIVRTHRMVNTGTPTART